MIKFCRTCTAFLLLLVTVCVTSCGDASRTPAKGTTPLFTAPAQYPAFSGDRAFALLEQQVAFGPRVPGTQAHAACLGFFLAHLDSLGIATERQDFTLPGYDGASLPLTNLIAHINPAAPRRILLAAHWDSRPWSDMETDPDRALLPVPGANDGASGVAVLLHLAEILSADPPPVGVDLVLFDGEDYGRENDESMFLLGSRYYAATRGSAPPPLFGILLDLVGDREARFPQEDFSRRYAGDVLDMVWDAAAALGLSRFTRETHPPILDDHVPLNTVAGIKTVNIIDAALVGHDDASPRRRYWHTRADLPHQCAPEPLGDVGALLLYLIFGIHPAETT
ncbi:MAG: M28 family peptidase [Bacteroidota bacterium]|nr:M28 family peptidase [Bacteroidota bacterium]